MLRLPPQYPRGYRYARRCANGAAIVPNNLFRDECALDKIGLALVKVRR
jgi:hypothetical protein